ncbi:hypothetical protein ABI_12520 [Asticcacaulis biprosthecium C19]|uniref:Uncharacterized protein n=1 Tax=Asticcacaulis biprosthecium C19 TaxID=715226 RepID=F4QHS7_9CAUL|nr:hypothetical protein ABI_12520 [Asticcacaulis biprosthecium C19]
MLSRDVDEADISSPAIAVKSGMDPHRLQKINKNQTFVANS